MTPPQHSVTSLYVLLSGVSRPAGWPKMRLGTPQGTIDAEDAQAGAGVEGNPAPTAAKGLPDPACE